MTLWSVVVSQPISLTPALMRLLATSSAGAASCRSCAISSPSLPVDSMMEPATVDGPYDWR